MKQMILFFLLLGGYGVFSQKTHQVTVGVNQVECTITGINVQSVNIYPNPSSQMLMIDANQVIHGVELIDLGGRVLFSRKHLDKSEVELDVSHLTKGVYSCILMFEGGKSAHKVVLK